MVGALRDEPPTDLVQRPLLKDRLVVVARAGHPLANEPAPTREALAQYPWIVGRAGSPLRALWQTMFAADALPAAPVECGSVTAIRGILRQSDLLTLLSRDQVDLEIAAGVLVSIGPPPLEDARTIGVTTRADWRPTPSQARFLSLLKAATDLAFQDFE